MLVMEVVMVSPNYEIELPPKVRTALNLQPGMH